MEEDVRKVLKEFERRIAKLESELDKKDRVIRNLSSTVNKLNRQLRSAKVKIDESRNSINYLNNKIRK